MYRNGRNRRVGGFNREDNFKTIFILTGSVLAIAIITFIVTYSIYNSKVNQSTEEIMDSSTLASLNSDNIAKSASSSIGKNIEQAKNELNTVNNDVIKDTVESDTKPFDVSDNVKVNTDTSSSINIVQSSSSVNDEIAKEEPKKDPVFSKPVEGNIIREYAKENLVYSETLDEWITHLGIDIKADKTTVVTASADGIVETIKNDPRYGLTVVISHDNGFKTVYSNLLTAEFVTEGEEVSSGQTLGTVGNNAAFEISDEPHLHFEMIKDNEKVDPTIYIRF